jgi:threonine dehydratase
VTGAPPPTSSATSTPVAGVYARQRPAQPLDDETVSRLPTRPQLEAARELISGRLWKTPVMPARQLSTDARRPTHLKLECLSSIRSFKARGALWSLAGLESGQRRAGVITASTGNHGQGVAYAGRTLGIEVTVISPHTLDPVKRAAMESLGATVVIDGNDINASSDIALRLSRDRGLTYIEDGEDAALLTGAATVLWEMFDDCPELDSVVVPVGGGNLIASCLWLAQVLDRPVAISGVQSTMAPGAMLSWQNGIMTSAECKTSAGGLATSRPGPLALSVMLAYLETMILVEERDLANAVAYVLHNEGVVIEPAAAAGVAGLRMFTRDVPGALTGVILTGGWISARDLDRLARAG